MLPSRIFAPALALFTFGLAASGAPIKRSNGADVVTIFKTLDTQTAPTFQQLGKFYTSSFVLVTYSLLFTAGELVNDGTASNDTVGPLFGQLVTAINTAHKSLSDLPSDLGDPQSNEDIANAFANSIIVSTLIVLKPFLA